MKIKVGIVGYGNLGKAVEKIVLSNPNFTLVACFSRRITKSKLNSKIESYDNILTYKNKIDVLFLCGSSKSDIEIQAPELAKHFCTINSFDNHKRLGELVKTLDSISNENKTISIVACGWDPGLFSIIRTLFFAISKETPYTFWGKGISMGHSDVIRQVSGVEDAVQFTIPNKEAVTLAKQGLLSENTPRHYRECFVLANKNKHKQIEKEIKNTPNYFKGQPTSVNFVSQIQLLKLKNKLSHSGKILTRFKSIDGWVSKMNFAVSMQSNPNFTASIMTAYAMAVKNLLSQKQYGAFTCLDVPPILLFEPHQKEKIIEKFC